MKSLKEKIKSFPQKPGVYYFKNKRGKILYIGKALSLKKRVQQYFSTNKKFSAKIEKMVSEATVMDYSVTDSEIEALLLESEMIKRYKPKYNERWKDEKNYLWVKITSDEDWPNVSLERRPMPDKSSYFGPFVDSSALKKSLKILRRIFPYITSRKFPHKLCFWGQLKQCPCYGMTKKEYKKNIKNLSSFFRGKKKEAIKEIKKEMKKEALAKNFEKAVALRNKMFALERFSQMTSYRILEDDYSDSKKDQALVDLFQKLHLSKMPDKIECYDISNLFGKSSVGSMVVFEKGIPKKEKYKKFKIKRVNKIDDYAMMSEILKRRFLKIQDEEFSQLPDLIIVDGGKGQLSSAMNAVSGFGLNVPVIGVAKKNEEIFIKTKNSFKKIILKSDSHALFLIQRIRDEAHRFAIVYHKLLRDKKITESELDGIKGIGKKTKNKLLLKFGSVAAIKKASFKELVLIVGYKKAKSLRKNLI